MFKLLVYAEEFWENVYYVDKSWFLLHPCAQTLFGQTVFGKHCLTCVASREALSQVCTLLSS